MVKTSTASKPDVDFFFKIMHFQFSILCDQKAETMPFVFTCKIKQKVINLHFYLQKTESLQHRAVTRNKQLLPLLGHLQSHRQHQKTERKQSQSSVLHAAVALAGCTKLCKFLVINNKIGNHLQNYASPKSH